MSPTFNFIGASALAGLFLSAAQALCETEGANKPQASKNIITHCKGLLHIMFLPNAGSKPIPKRGRGQFGTHTCLRPELPVESRAGNN
jgi:hypothetical protein